MNLLLNVSLVKFKKSKEDRWDKNERLQTRLSAIKTSTFELSYMGANGVKPVEFVKTRSGPPRFYFALLPNKAMYAGFSSTIFYLQAKCRTFPGRISSLKLYVARFHAIYFLSALRKADFVFQRNPVCVLKDGLNLVHNLWHVMESPKSQTADTSEHNSFVQFRQRLIVFMWEAYAEVSYWTPCLLVFHT